jgi:hypothetical protein
MYMHFGWIQKVDGHTPCCSPGYNWGRGTRDGCRKIKTEQNEVLAYTLTLKILELRYVAGGVEKW